MKKSLIFVFLFSCFWSAAQQPDTTWVLKNLSINSVADDYSPFVVDSMLLFTSTRKNVLEDKLLESTEKVYYTLMADTSFGIVKKFSYKANSDANSALVGCSDSSFFFYRSYFPDNGEIFIAPKKQELHIKALQKIRTIKSDFDENSIAIRGDSIYFTSNRDGNYDIFLQTGNEKPIPVDSLNSLSDELGVWISPSGKEMYFNSNREGSFDVYVSYFDGSWQATTKLPEPINTSEFDDIDYRKYNDSTIFFSSNRSGGMGGYDIYKSIKPIFESNDTLPVEDTIPKLDTVPVIDSIPEITKQFVPFDSLPPREQLEVKIKEFGLDTIKGEIQLGAYRRYLTDITLFKKRFPCIKNENIRMDVFEEENKSPLRKFIIDTIYIDLDDAIDKQIDIVRKGCFPTQPQGSIPFVALLKENSRYAIFWSKETLNSKEEFWILKDGKEVWRSK